MKKILVLGALPNENNERWKLYEEIKEVCGKVWEVIWTPIDTKNFVWSNEERSDRAYWLVGTSDVCIFELSDTSPWALVEFGRASAWDKQTLIISKEWSMIHPLMTGNSLTNNKIISYKTKEELFDNLTNFLTL